MLYQLLLPESRNDQEMTSSEQWRYVATEDNPADFVSRGMDSLKLKTCRSITSIVEPDLTNLNENRLDNWQKITKIIQLIWKRWSVDYLNSLQQRNKWHFEKKNAKIGDMRDFDFTRSPNDESLKGTLLSSFIWNHELSTVIVGFIPYILITVFEIIRIHRSLSKMPNFEMNGHSEKTSTSKTRFQNLELRCMEDYHKLYQLSVENPEVFWTRIADEFAWHKKPNENCCSYNFDPTKGPVSIKWMANGETNICYNALDLNVKNGLGNKIAYYW
ncbi:acetyl-coenzyme A synthetase [Trichonephila clavipes]|nr:acetyl-coenzyme A synthetase [Trichonephila clavipes]